MAFATLPAAKRSPHPRVDPVERAMAAAGGRDLLARVRVIAWSGTARVMLGKTPVDLNVETRIEPFVRGRSDTWLTSEGRSTARTLMTERDSGFLVHEGAQTPLPAAQARFEQQQLGGYAYLLLAPAFVSAGGAGRLNAAREGFPPMALHLAPDGRIVSADYVLASPAFEGVSVRQQWRCSGTVSAQGVRFPKVVAIVQDGRPLLRMTIADFSVELSPQ